MQNIFFYQKKKNYGMYIVGKWCLRICNTEIIIVVTNLNQDKKIK